MPNKLNLKTQRGISGGFRGSQIKKSGRLSNGWTDWHHVWYTSADSSGNGHRLNTSCPSIPQGALGGGLGCHKLKSLGNLSNGCTDWHQIWYMSADSSGNGHRLNTIPPTMPWLHFGGGRGGHKFKSLLKLSNSWTDWHHVWYTSADSSWNGHRLNVICPSTFGEGGGLGVTNSKVRGRCETAGPIATKFGTHVHIHLGMDIRQTNCPKTHKGAFGGF